MLLRRMEGVVRPDGPLAAGQRLILLMLMTAAGSAAFLLFDWNQLAPGIGVLPQEVGIATFWLIALVLYVRPVKPLPAEVRVATLIVCALCAWAAAGLVLMMTISVFSGGVIWHHASISGR